MRRGRFVRTVRYKNWGDDYLVLSPSERFLLVAYDRRAGCYEARPWGSTYDLADGPGEVVALVPVPASADAPVMLDAAAVKVLVNRVIDAWERDREDAPDWADDLADCLV